MTVRGVVEGVEATACVVEDGVVDVLVEDWEVLDELDIVGAAVDELDGVVCAGELVDEVDEVEEDALVVLLAVLLLLSETPPRSWRA